MLCHLFSYSHPQSPSIGRHYHHNVFRLFHCMDMKWDSIHCTLDWIDISHIFVVKVCNDFIARNIFGPLPAFLDKSCCKQSSLLEPYNSLKNTQNPLSRTNNLPVDHTGLLIQSRIPIVLPILLNSLWPRFCGWSFPPLKSNAQMMLLSSQPVLWFLMPNFQAFLGMYIIVEF